MIPLRTATDGEGEVHPLRLLAETDPDERGKVVARTLGAWISIYPGEVPGPQKGKQGAVGKRFAESYDPREIALILWGMQFLYPYSEGAAWDLFDAERKAAKALAEARMAIQNGGSRSDADRKVQREAESLAERLRKRRQQRGA